MFQYTSKFIFCIYVTLNIIWNPPLLPRDITVNMWLNINIYVIVFDEIFNSWKWTRVHHIPLFHVTNILDARKLPLGGKRMFPPSANISQSRKSPNYHKGWNWNKLKCLKVAKWRMNGEGWRILSCLRGFSELWLQSRFC